MMWVCGRGHPSTIALDSAVPLRTGGQFEDTNWRFSEDKEVYLGRNGRLGMIKGRLREDWPG